MKRYIIQWLTVVAFIVVIAPVATACQQNQAVAYNESGLTHPERGEYDQAIDA